MGESIDCPEGGVAAASLNYGHNFSKINIDSIRLIEDRGILGDAHYGETVQHFHLAKKDPERANLRQVHLIASERIREWQESGHSVNFGSLGENITTCALNLESLPKGARLKFDSGAEIILVGLRKPCLQVDKFSCGLLQLTITKNELELVTYIIGVMAIISRGGEVYKGDRIKVTLPPLPHQALVHL